MWVLISALAVGLVMGLTGAGGGIIGVPALMYGANMTTKVAVAHSLLVLALLCWVSAVMEWRRGNLKLASAVVFSISGVVGSFLAARYISPILTEATQLAMFCFFLFLAGLSMIRTAFRGRPKPAKGNVFGLLLAGLLVGAVAGMLGLGGGFLIVPALILILAYPPQQAVGTALGIIALNSTSGVIGYWGLVDFRWNVALLFAGCGLAGSIFGMKVRAKIPDRLFKLFFALSLFGLGAYIFVTRVLPAYS